jgi:tetratricopeptide (TPR) repeat protein
MGVEFRKMIAATVVLAVVSAAIVPARADEALDAYNRASQLYTNKDFNGALAAYQSAASLKPNWADPQAMVGTTLGVLGRFDEMWKEYDKALAIEKPPGHVSVYVYYQSGLMHGSKHEEEKALESFKKGLALDPTHAKIWRNVGMSNAHLGKWNLVVDAFERSLASNPDQPDLKKLLPDARKKAGLDEGKPEASGAGIIKLVREPKALCEASFDLPALGGWVTTTDEKTLVLSIPSTQELVYLDVTGTANERKRAKLDFQPGRLAIQGKTLLATSVGKPAVLVLDLETGKTLKTIKTPDEVVELACHRTTGLVYASTTQQEVYSIDAHAGTIAKTQAKGRFLALDPKGAFVYIADVGGDKAPTVLRKMAPKGKDLAPVAVNKTAETGGIALHVAPSGRSAVVVGTSSRAPVGGGVETFLGAVLSTDDLVTCFGEVDFCARADAVALHPVLPMGVALRHDGGMVQFDSKTFARTKLEYVEERPTGSDPSWVAFTARCEKVVCWQPPVGEAKGRLSIVPLVLTAEEKAAIAKALGPPAK